MHAQHCPRHSSIYPRSYLLWFLRNRYTYVGTYLSGNTQRIAGLPAGVDMQISIRKDEEEAGEATEKKRAARVYGMDDNLRLPSIFYSIVLSRCYSSFFPHHHPIPPIVNSIPNNNLAHRRFIHLSSSTGTEFYSHRPHNPPLLSYPFSHHQGNNEYK